MIYEKKEIGKFEEDKAILECYIHNECKELGNGERRSLIICPGGGYSFLSEREAEPVALRFFASGMNAFVLRYAVNEKAGNFTPLVQALSAVAYLRKNSDKLHILKDRIFIGGFSAGAHVAATAGTLFALPDIKDRLGDDFDICRPDGMILCYPVITGGKYSHYSSICKAAGSEHPTEAQLKLFSAELQVTDNTPPAFIWHTANDETVSIQNSLLFSSALSVHKIPFELHIYPNGSHGLSLCNKETYSGYDSLVLPYAENWIDHAIRWASEFPDFCK